MKLKIDVKIGICRVIKGYVKVRYNTMRKPCWLHKNIGFKAFLNIANYYLHQFYTILQESWYDNTIRIWYYHMNIFDRDNVDKLRYHMYNIYGIENKIMKSGLWKLWVILHYLTKMLCKRKYKCQQCIEKKIPAINSSHQEF